MSDASGDCEKAMELLSPDYEALRDFMRDKFGISNEQATGIAYWFETEYDCATKAGVSLLFTYFEWLAKKSDQDVVTAGSIPPDGGGKVTH
jgi:hypothetical protein